MFIDVTHVNCAVKANWEPCYPRAMRGKFSVRVQMMDTHKNCIIH